MNPLRCVPVTLAPTLAACLSYPDNAPPVPEPFEDGPLVYEVLTHRPAPQTGIATGSFE